MIWHKTSLLRVGDKRALLKGLLLLWCLWSLLSWVRHSLAFSSLVYFDMYVLNSIDLNRIVEVICLMLRSTKRSMIVAVKVALSTSGIDVNPVLLVKVVIKPLILTRTGSALLSSTGISNLNFATLWGSDGK
jgi:hypothetical protein